MNTGFLVHGAVQGEMFWQSHHKKYPDICTPERIEDIFDPPDIPVDLYNDVVKKGTEWPPRDFSIKTLAQYLDFKWKASPIRSRLDPIWSTYDYRD